MTQFSEIPKTGIYGPIHGALDICTTKLHIPHRPGGNVSDLFVLQFVALQTISGKLAENHSIGLRFLIFYPVRKGFFSLDVPNNIKKNKISTTHKLGSLFCVLHIPLHNQTNETSANN